MPEFSADQARRWAQWQSASIVSAHRSEMTCRFIAASPFAASILVVLVAALQR
jgi:hypothetical protein